MNAGHEAGAQFGLEARARAAVLATAEEIRADDVPAAPAWLAGGSLDGPARRDGWAGRSGRDGRDGWAGRSGLRPGERRGWAGRGGGRWGVPLAAAAAVVMAAAVTAALTVTRLDQGDGITPGVMSPVAEASANSAAAAASANSAAAAAKRATAAKQAAAAAAAAKQAGAPSPADLESGLIGMFVPASGASYSAGANLRGEYQALESQLTSRCMAKAGFSFAPATSESIARQDFDLTRYPDLDAIARAGAMPGDVVTGTEKLSGSPALAAAFKRCGAASDALFGKMVTAGLSLGGPFSATVTKIQGSAPVLATVPALRACAARHGWQAAPQGLNQPINSLADFVTWVSGHLDQARSGGAPAAAVRKLDARWASVFVQCARPTVTVMERLQLAAQRPYLASHKEQLAALVAVGEAEFAQARG